MVLPAYKQLAIDLLQEYKIMDSTEKLKDSLMQSVRDISDAHTALRKNKQAVLQDVLKGIKRLEKREAFQLLTLINEHFSMDELTEPYVKQAGIHGVKISSGASFKESLTRASAKRQISGKKLEMCLNSKAAGYRFVEKLGIACPKVIAKSKRYTELELKPGTILKPTDGSSSNGVFIIGDQVAFEVKTGNIINGRKALEEKVENLRKNKIVKKDSWSLESFIGDVSKEVIEPPRDLKFYCFYGKLGFVLEVDRAKKTSYCEWAPDMSVADTGRYEAQSFIGSGFTNEELIEALKISSELPFPFMRIDFLKSKNEFVFGEFTPRPGQYSSFNKNYDRYLGELFLDAEARLHHDILNGKKFDSFKSMFI